MTQTLWAFLGISLLVIATPGPDTALTVRNTLLGARRGGGFTAAGVAAGQAFWTFAWLRGYALALSLAGNWIRRRTIWRRIEAITGGALVALGLRLAAEQR